MPFSTPCLPIEINARQVPTIRSAHVTGDQRVFPQIRVANWSPVKPNIASNW